MSRDYNEVDDKSRRVTPLGALKLIGVGKALLVVAVILIVLTGVDRMRYMKGNTPVFARKSDVKSREIYLGIGYTVEYFSDENPEWRWFYE